MDMSYNEFLEQQEYNEFCKKAELLKKIRACTDTLESYFKNTSNGLLLDDAFNSAEVLSEASDTIYKEIEAHYDEWKQQEEQNEIKASYR
jgi:hypothetical protein